MSNKRQNGWTDRAQIFSKGHRVTLENVQGWSYFQNIASNKNIDFWKFWKSKKFVYNVYKETMFTIEMEDGRKAP